MIKARVKEMEEEAEKIKQMQNEVEKMAHSSSSKHFLYSFKWVHCQTFLQTKGMQIAKYHDLLVNITDTH